MSNASETPEASKIFDSLLQIIHDRRATIAIQGMGYVGLPMGLLFVRHGYNVIGLDRDSSKCDMLMKAESYITDVSSAQLTDALATGRFLATTDTAYLRSADVVLMCVPTPLYRETDDAGNKIPDLRPVVGATQDILDNQRSGQLIILESTTYPGTTREIILAPLEGAGYKVGEDLFVAYSPERVDPGNVSHAVETIPKLTGGITQRCTQLSAALYRSIGITVHEVSTAEAAEAAKLLENTFRCVNIALANEMALICRALGIDVWEVVEAAGTKPFGFMKHLPGPGTGGHCIPLDPHYLTWKARQAGYDAQLIPIAGEINDNMPHRIIEIAEKILGRHMAGLSVHVMGVAYKPNVADVRESPAIELIHKLRQLGATVTYTDPHVMSLDEEGIDLKTIEVTSEVLAESEIVILVTNHHCFDYEFLVTHARMVLDTRNALRTYVGRSNVFIL